MIKARLYWSEFLKEFKAKTVVYVVDAANHQRIDEAKTALSQFSEKNKTENLQLLIVANKQVKYSWEQYMFQGIMRNKETWYDCR